MPFLGRINASSEIKYGSSYLEFCLKSHICETFETSKRHFAHKLKRRILFSKTCHLKNPRWQHLLYWKLRQARITEMARDI